MRREDDWHSITNLAARFLTQHCTPRSQRRTAKEDDIESFMCLKLHSYHTIGYSALEVARYVIKYVGKCDSNLTPTATSPPALPSSSIPCIIAQDAFRPVEIAISREEMFRLTRWDSFLTLTVQDKARLSLLVRFIISLKTREEVYIFFSRLSFADGKGRSSFFQ